MFNSKFGVGILKHPGYNIGGGIGEAALIGAAFGGAKALATGEDPLQAALLGGVTGGAMSGVMGAFGGAAPAAGTTGAIAKDATGQVLASAVPGTTGVGAFTNAINQGANVADDVVAASVNQASQVANAGLTGLPITNAGGMANIGLTQGAGLKAAEQAALANAGKAGLSSGIAQPGITSQLTANAPNNVYTAAKEFINPEAGGMVDKGLNYAIKNPGIASAGLGYGYGALTQAPPRVPELAKEKSKLAEYDRNEFTPYEAAPPSPYPQAQYTDYRMAANGGVMQSYAEGGIAALAQGGMGNNMGFPQGRLDSTQYATPTQMPTSAQVVNADYEQATDPYMGSPLKMAEGGVAHYAFGGNTKSGGQVYYDPDKGQYYTQDSAGPFGFMSSFANQLPNGGMNFFGGTPFSDGRTYITGGMPGAGGMSGFQSPQATPNVYQPSYNPIQVAQAATNPAVQQSVLSGGGGNQGYSLSDSLPLLQSTNPGIASMYAPPQTEEVEKKAQGGIAGYSLGGYAAGGNPRLLKGPGDGMSDNIPATIGDRQPARLADGEFVVPADVVSHLGNGSTDAGAKHLYGMMDKVRKARTGNKKQGKQINPAKYMPA